MAAVCRNSARQAGSGSSCPAARASSSRTRCARSYSSIACSGGVAHRGHADALRARSGELIMWNTMPACRDWSKCRPCRATASNRSPIDSARSSSASRWSVATRCFSSPLARHESARLRVVAAVGQELQREERVRRAAFAEVQLDRVRQTTDPRHPARRRSRRRTVRSRPRGPAAAPIAIPGSLISREYAGSAGNVQPR